MDKKEKKMIKQKSVMPDLEQFKKMVEKARAAVYEKPDEIKPGQIWGITGKEYRFVVLSSPEDSITGKDVRVVPVTHKVHMATETDVILPEDFVYYSESVVLPFQVTNIMKERLDLYHGELKKDITDFLLKTDNKGELATLPNFTRQGRNDPYDPIIFEYNENLREELFSFAQEVFHAADLVEDEERVTVFDTVEKTLLEFLGFLKNALASPEPEYMMMMAMTPERPDFNPRAKNKKILLKSHDNISIALATISSEPVMVFTALNLEDDRDLTGVRITLTSGDGEGSYSDFHDGNFGSRQINFLIPENIVQNMKNGFVLTYKLAGQAFELPVNFK
ncbi:MAG: hypothetical protein LCH52_13910 [Bacteroidetes bacterium]|nr:hypothetical protein [Bacteroidota bacterium]